MRAFVAKRSQLAIETHHAPPLTQQLDGHNPVVVKFRCPRYGMPTVAKRRMSVVEPLARPGPQWHVDQFLLR
jgi:hypothetical protein